VARAQAAATMTAQSAPDKHDCFMSCPRIAFRLISSLLALIFLRIGCSTLDHLVWLARPILTQVLP